MANKLTYEYIKSYIESFGFILISKLYINNSSKLELICPNNHFFNISYNKFNLGRRCKHCSGKEKFTNEYVFNYYKNEGYFLKNIYKNIFYKNKLICPNGHNIEITFNNFKNHNSRCNYCYRELNYGENHPNFNPKREEIPLNQRLRNFHKKSWIIKNMKDDPNYKNFLLKPNDYVVDHIIPIKLFYQLFSKYNLDEQQIKFIINQKHNLQLLTLEQNHKKFTKGSSLFEATQYLINNGIPFEKFLEENKNI